jgi:type III secretory pathway component EscU
MFCSFMLYQFPGLSAIFVCESYTNLTSEWTQKSIALLIIGYFDYLYQSYENVKKLKGKVFLSV